ncbi:MAG: iron ABC transporter permease [Bacteroidota bacterium]
MLTRRAAYALAAAVAVVLGGYVLWPNLATFALGLEGAGIRTFFDGWDAAGVRALRNSVGIALATVVGAGVLGTALAYAFFRYDLPLKGVLQGVAVLPLALPPLVGVLAFLFLYSESGVIPRALQVALGLDAVPFRFEGLSAVWLVHVYAFYVYFYLFVAAALARLDRSLLDASADLGASGWTTLRRVVLPLLRPALVGAALLVFMVAMASFTAPLLFAEDEPFLTVYIYQQKINGNLALSATASVVLTSLCLLFLVGLELGPRFSGRGRGPLGGVAGKGAGRGGAPIRSGWARALAGVAVGAMLLFVLLPVAMVVLLSFVQEGAWTTQVLPPAYTLDNWRAVFADPDVAAPIRNSLWMATVATAANVVFGVATALVIAKTKVVGRGLLRALALLPFAVPGTVIALGLIVAFDEPSALGFGQILVGTFWLLPLAYFVRHLPLVVQATQAALDAYDDRLTEASADLGAGAWTTFRRVVWPVILPSVAAGTLLTFVTALGEFVASILLYVFGNRPISVEIFAQLRLYDLGAAAAYSVLLIGLVVAASAVTRIVSGSQVAGRRSPV